MKNNAICDSCETVSHCSKHGCIPKSQHPAMAALIEDIENNLNSPHSSSTLDASEQGGSKGLWLIVCFVGAFCFGLVMGLSINLGV